jgi:hypothetical protein
MATRDGSTQKRRGWVWVLAVLVVILISAAWLLAPGADPRSTGDTGQKLATAGVVAAGPPPSQGLMHPGSMTQGLADTDSRDNGTPNAGRKAPSPDAPPTPAPAGPAAAGSKPS